MIESKELDKLNKKLKKVTEKLLTTSDELGDEIYQALVAGGNDIRNTIITSMSRESKTGRIYKRGKKEHKASAPGEAPAVDHGELLRSIMFNVRESTFRTFELEVGSKAGAPYAVYLEEGTKNKNGTPRIEPRPWLKPAVDKHQEDIRKDVGLQVFQQIVDNVKKSL